MKKQLSHPLLILFLSLLVMATSCTTKKNLIYMQGFDDGETTIKNTEQLTYRVQPNDNLYIKVLGMDELATSVFNLTEGQSYMNSDAAIELSSYTINVDGTIDFPYIGQVEVANKTIPEIKQIVQQKIDPFVQQSSVVVKLVNKQITVLGEVQRPGKYLITSECITLFEALGYAGDLTDYGNRKKVRVVRNGADGKRTYSVDLTSSRLLSDKHFYLLPNDIVYVEPDSKVFGKKGLSFTVVFTAISSAILIYNSFLTK
ncbi:MAG: polysaccharide export protein [Bacteroidales bacterium]|nr:polysaccharide export protein [Bacteroidales bacterium]MDD2323202.1 polysaccharide export protein [Bacteroidales bacterium]MDD3961936.1 polysaccharide export protein [Bacteroidales bacterium]MDY0285441.1 polysaccharide biosynthesis/export family protein [Bacteroidales bacterium]